MSVESSVAQHSARLDAHEKSHDAHKDEFGKVWVQLEEGRKAREQTNLQIEKLNGNVGTLSTNFESLDAFIRGDVRRAFIGLIVVVGVLAACVVLALTGDIAAIHDAAKAALPGGP